MEACVTLGMLRPHQAERLAAAGLTAYNHNLHSGPDFYGQIVTTRHTRSARHIGDSAIFRHRLAAAASSAWVRPFNVLVPVKGTPLANRPRIDSLDFVRMVATGRLVMPSSTIRLSAGRSYLSREAQILCMVAGANSVFYGDTLLTTPNADRGKDNELFAAIGRPKRAEVPAPV
jgi:biotin synthase